MRSFFPLERNCKVSLWSLERNSHLLLKLSAISKSKPIEMAGSLKILKRKHGSRKGQSWKSPLMHFQVRKTWNALDCFWFWGTPGALHPARGAVLVPCRAVPQSPASQRGSVWKVNHIFSASSVQHIRSSASAVPHPAFPTSRGCFCLRHPGQHQH